jgi:hypothetical protein
MQQNATYIRPKVVGPFPGPCPSGSYVHRAAIFMFGLFAKGPSTWWLESAGGTPQVGGSTPGLGLKNLTRQFHSKHMVKARPSVALAAGPYVWVGKAHVLKHKLRTGPWVVLTGNGSLCMGGCGVLFFWPA